MKMIYGCLLVLIGATLVAGGMLPDAHKILPSAPLESSENTEQTPLAAVTPVNRAGISQAAPDLPQSTAIIISGHARKEEKVQPALGDDLAHSSGVPSVAASDARQARKNFRTHDKNSVRSCNYLGCTGVTVGGIGF
jgi:hypothetical protein